jgi:hypothetical protein
VPSSGLWAWQGTDGTPIAPAAVLQNGLIWNVGMARLQFAEGAPNGGYTR